MAVELTNTITLEGFVSGSLTRRSGRDGVVTDFTLSHNKSDFQVIAECYVVKKVIDGTKVTVCGRLIEDAGDVYISADSVEPDCQIELVFQ